jgi:hypothetical protein
MWAVHLIEFTAGMAAGAALALMITKHRWTVPQMKGNR